MGSDLTYYANAWPGYDNPCVRCGAGCRAIDRFCSQCGQIDPLGPRKNEPITPEDEELLRAPTMIVGDVDELRPDATVMPIALPQDAPTMLGTGSQSTSRAPRRRRTAEATLALERMLVPG